MHEIKITSVTQVGNDLTMFVSGLHDEEGKELDGIALNIDAIGSRMAFYGLDSPKEALKAIICEHYVRVSPDFTSPESREELTERSGHSEIKVVGLSSLDSILSENAERIEHARQLRTT